jgi:hypothetical protein
MTLKDVEFDALMSACFVERAVVRVMSARGDDNALETALPMMSSPSPSPT